MADFIENTKRRDKTKLYSKKRFAWVFLSILKNNIVNSTLYYCLLILESLQIIFISVIYAFLFHGLQTEADSDNIWNSLQAIKTFLDSIEKSYQFHIVILITILALNLSIFISMFVLAFKLDSPEKAKKSNLFSKIFSIVLLFNCKILFQIKIFLLAVIFKNPNLSLSEKIFYFGGATLCLLMTVIIELMTKNLLNLRLRMIQQVPWCQQKSIVPIIKSSIKFAQFMWIFLEDNISLAIAIMLALVTIQLYAFIFFQPFHNKFSYFIELTFLSMIFCQYFELTINIVSKLDSRITILVYVISVFFPIFFQMISLKRQQRLKASLLNKTLKSEFDIEKALSLFIDDIINFRDKQANLSLQGIILTHRENCKSIDTCFCSQYDECLISNRFIIRQSLYREKHRMYEEEEMMYKSIQEVQNGEREKQIMKTTFQNCEERAKIKGPQSSSFGAMQLNEFSIGQTCPQEFLERDQELQIEEQKQFYSGILNPIFQAEHQVSQNYLMKIQQQKKLNQNLYALPEPVQQLAIKYNNDLSFLDVNSIKLQTVINIIYKLVKEYCEQNQQNIRLHMFKSYFELFVMKKKYLAHQTLTTMTGDSLSLINYTQYHVDQQFMIEQAILLYQQKEDQLIDVDKISTQNYHFQDFYDLNKETSYQLNLFWSLLIQKNANIDIEKLYQVGVKTSELIKKTKDKFEKIVDLGIDKKNSNFYYIYAYFNRHALNSNDLFTKYLNKMKQIKRMNKTIYDNYQESLILEADKSGFVIVKGSYSDFGKVLFANRQLCSMLGYQQEQLNGKLINLIMPSLISNYHHRFLTIFRETGNPVFIQRQQQLFLKNSRGYIQPFKCYIKFHYDKVHGHVFCAIVNKTKVFYPFKNKKKHYIDEVLTIMTDELGSIQEISHSVTKYLGIPIKVIQENQVFLQDNLKIDNLLKIDLHTVDQEPNKEIITHINPNFQTEGTGQIVLQQQRRQAMMDSRHSPGRLDSTGSFDKLLIDVRVKMAKLRHKDFLTVRYFFIQILDQQKDNELLFDQNNLLDVDITVTHSSKESVQEEQIKAQFQQSSESGSQASYSSSYSQGQKNEFIEKDIDSLLRNSQRTPKILKQILWLVIFGLASIIIISSTIMTMFLQNSTNGQINLALYQKSMESIMISSQVMNNLRTLIDINNGVETISLLKQTDIWKIEYQNNPNMDINTKLSKIIMDSLTALKVKQQFIDRYNFDEKVWPYTSGQLFKQITLESINSQGNIEQSDYEGTNSVVNLLIGNILSILDGLSLLTQTKTYNQNFTSYYGQFQYFLKQKELASNYQLLQMQQKMFFVFQNYKYSFINSTMLLSNDYLEIAIHQLDENLVQKILVMICISIATLIVVLGLVSPITFKIKKQKYQVLLFFLELKDDIIEQCYNSSQQFEGSYYSETNKKFFFDSSDNILIEKNQSDLVSQYNQGDNKYNPFSSNFGDDLVSVMSFDHEGIEQFQDRKFRLRQVENKLQMIRQNYLQKFQTKMTNFNSSDFVDVIEEGDFDASLDFSRSTSQFDSRFNNVNTLSRKNTRELSQFALKSSENVRKQAGREKVYKSSGNSTLAVNQIHQQKGAGIIHKFNLDEKEQDREINHHRGHHKTQPLKQLGSIEEEHFGVEGTWDNMAEMVTFAMKGDKLNRLKELQEKEKDRTVQIQPILEMADEIQGANEFQGTIVPSKQTQQTLLNTLNDKKQTVVQIGEEIQELEESAYMQMQFKIKKISTKSQSAGIVSLLALFFGIASYFISIFVISDQTIKEFKHSYKHLNDTYQRSSCMSILLYLTKEDFYTNDDPGSGKDILYKKMSYKQLQECIDLETRYIELQRDTPQYYSQAEEIISQSESDQLCTLISQSHSDITINQCRTIDNYAFYKGLGRFNQNMIQIILKMQLDFFNTQISNRNRTFILQKLQSLELLDYISTNNLLLYDINWKINQKAYDSIIHYFGLVEQIHIALYSILIFASITLLLVFIFYLFNRMKRDMLSSHTMISMLPKSQLQRTDQIKIKEFLIS